MRGALAPLFLCLSVGIMDTFIATLNYSQDAFEQCRVG